MNTVTIISSRAREETLDAYPPESLNAAGPHGPLIRQPLASSLRFRYQDTSVLCCAVTFLTVSSAVIIPIGILLRK